VSAFRRRLLVFGFPLLEVVTAYAVAQLIGWGWMLLLLIAGIPAGFAVMRNAGDAAMRDAVQAQQTGQPLDGGRHALAFVGGVLIAIPGFWTDLVGLLLAVPLTQRLFRARARRWFEARFTTVRMPGIRTRARRRGPGRRDPARGRGRRRPAGAARTPRAHLT
jgi:UPF0716 protein FxsA